MLVATVVVVVVVSRLCCVSRVSAAAQLGLDLLEKGELSEEEFSGLVKAEEGFQKVMFRVLMRHLEN